MSPKKQWIEISITITGGDAASRDELASTIQHQARTVAKRRGLTIDVSTSADEGL